MDGRGKGGWDRLGRCPMTMRIRGAIDCPIVECGTQLQPLDRSTSWPVKAAQYAAALDVPLATAWPFYSLTAHAMIVHDDLDLGDYLNAYLDN